MSEFVRICSQAELPLAGRVRAYEAAGRTFCVANADGKMHVLGGVCPHAGGPLGEGTLAEGSVVCPWHQYAFDLKTGEAVGEPTLKADVFESRLENGELKAKV